MDVSLLERLVRLMSANDLNTVDVRDGDKRVILKRGATVSFVAPSASSGSYVPQATPSATPTHAPPPAAQSEDAGLVAIKSPMVGTFYSSPSPDAKAFVNVGTKVDEETDVCIIEAMKVFNNIKAETRGTIAKILVNNGETVEFGQTLFLVKA
jgi:acetyl-CoA carboxylase biotin carboxyl carrier protein